MMLSKVFPNEVENLFRSNTVISFGLNSIRDGGSRRFRRTISQAGADYPASVEQLL
jgi:hypothetical protein